MLAVTVLLSYVTRCCQVWPFEKRGDQKILSLNRWFMHEIVFCDQQLPVVTRRFQEWPAYGNICVVRCHWMLPGVVRCDQLLPAVTRSGFFSKKVKNHVFVHFSVQVSALWMKIGQNDRDTSTVHETKKMVALRLKVKFLRPKMSKTFREPQLRGLLSYRAEIWRADSLGTNLDIINIPTFS